MKRNLAGLALLVAMSLLAVPASASAAPTLWGGNGFNDLGPSSTLLAVKNGRVLVKNVQLIMACTDVEDGTESARAFTARFNNYESLRSNRFNTGFSAQSGGRIGWVYMNGRLGSNGIGKVRVEVEAVATGINGETVERCQGATNIPVRRPR